MVLPLAPILPAAVRLGAVAIAGLATRRWLKRHSFPGRTDQRAEDALDEMGEGVSLHRPKDRASADRASADRASAYRASADRASESCAGEAVSQTNTTARMVRVIRFRGQTWELDAGVIARFRLRRRAE